MEKIREVTDKVKVRAMRRVHWLELTMHFDAREA